MNPVPTELASSPGSPGTFLTDCEKVLKHNCARRWPTHPCPVPLVPNTAPKSSIPHEGEKQIPAPLLWRNSSETLGGGKVSEDSKTYQGHSLCRPSAFDAEIAGAGPLSIIQYPCCTALLMCLQHTLLLITSNTSKLGSMRNRHRFWARVQSTGSISSQDPWSI